MDTLMFVVFWIGFFVLLALILRRPKGSGASAGVIDERFNLLAMEGESLICTFEPNSRFTAYQYLQNAWHPFVIIALPVIWLFTLYSRRFQKYWLTNKRLIAASGMLGFSVKSIPLEKIADVQLIKTVLHNILGTTSLSAMDVSGNSPISIISIDNAAEFQLQILEEVNKA